MKILFAGTGAADWDWRLPLKPGTRGSSCTLLERHVLLDCGPTACASLERAGVELAEITDLLITHTHSDHFQTEQIRQIASAPGRRASLRIYASPEGVARCAGLPATVRNLVFGEEFPVGGLRCRVLPANHLLTDPGEHAHHFLFTLPDGRRLLYALDGAWMTSYARALLGKEPLAMIVWDATSGTSAYDWRFAEHNDLLMIRYLQTAMKGAGLIDGNTRHVLDHLARTLWPENADARLAAAAGVEAVIAEDGMTLEL